MGLRLYRDTHYKRTQYISSSTLWRGTALSLYLYTWFSYFPQSYYRKIAISLLNDITQHAQAGYLHFNQVIRLQPLGLIVGII